MADPSSSVIARNPSAGRDYIFLETFEAGIELNGAEVKSLRSGRVNMKEAFARIDEGQVFLYGLDISPWPQASMRQEPKRPRRLLLHREQIDRLQSKLSGNGLTIAAIKIYFKKALVKVEIALAQGKKQYDRREDIKKRESERKEWQRRRDTLDEGVQDSRFAARGRHFFYTIGMLFGFLVLAVASIGFLTIGPTTVRRVIGGVVIAAEIVLIFLGHLIASSALRFMP